MSSSSFPVRDKPDNMVVMMEHEAFDHAFKALYDHGMRLIEQASAYSNNEGRLALSKLAHEATGLYSGEVMRLSARLMQAASWLLLERAAREKDMSVEDLVREKKKVVLNMEPPLTGHPAWPLLPEKFRNLVEESMRLLTRIRHMDAECLKESGAMPVANMVETQLKQLKKSFGGK